MENPYQVPGHDSTDGARAARGRIHTIISVIIGALCILQFVVISAGLTIFFTKHGISRWPLVMVVHGLALRSSLALGGLFLVLRRRLAAICFATCMILYLARFGTSGKFDVPMVVLSFALLAYALWLWKSGLLRGWPNIPAGDATEAGGAALEAQNFSATLENRGHASIVSTATSSSRRRMMIATLLLVCPQVFLTALLAPTFFERVRVMEVGALVYLIWISLSILLALGARLLLLGRGTALYLFAGAVLLAALAYLQWRSQLHWPGVIPSIFIAGCAGVVGFIASCGSPKVPPHS